MENSVLRQTFEELQINPKNADAISAFMRPLQLKDRQTYFHCIRVGLLARQIAKSMGLDETALFYAGLLHDVGKCQTKLETLRKTEGWTKKDTVEMSSHVDDGYRMIRGHFDFTADILILHHWYQQNRTPKRLPKLLHEYSEATKAQIKYFGLLIAIADTYDAFHRVNDRNGEKRALSEEEIKELMLKHHFYAKKLINALYDRGVLKPFDPALMDS